MKAVKTSEKENLAMFDGLPWTRMRALGVGLIVGMVLLAFKVWFAFAVWLLPRAKARAGLVPKRASLTRYISCLSAVPDVAPSRDRSVTLR